MAFLSDAYRSSTYLWSITTIARAAAFGLAAASAGCSGSGGSDAVARVTVNPADSTLMGGESLQLTAACLDASGAALDGLPIEWTSDNSAATVTSQGEVWAVSLGSATISATCSGVVGTAVIRVVKSDTDGGMYDAGNRDAGTPTDGGPNDAGGTRVPVASVSMTPASATLLATGTLQLLAEPRDANGQVLADERILVWRSSNTSVATVDARGFVVGVGPGATTISATIEGKTASTTITGHEAVPGMVTAGEEHACGLTRYGRAYCWGWGVDGALGSLTAPPVNQPGAPPPPPSLSSAPRILATPTPVAGELLFRTLSAGNKHTCGITIAGAAYCWGSSYLGDGRAWDQNGLSGASAYVPVAVATEIKFDRISAGATHTCALTTQGAAFCWGANHGQLGNGADSEAELVPVPVAGGLTFKSISAAYGSTLALTTAGSAYHWGSAVLIGTETKQILSPVPVTGGHTFSQISNAGAALGLKSDGTAYAWGGSNRWGTLGTSEAVDDNPIGMPTPVLTSLRFRTLVAGPGTSIGVTTDGELAWWGPLNVDDNLDDVISGNGRSVTYYTPYTFGDYDFSQVAAGHEFMVGINPDGVMMGLGQNNRGQLGLGEETATQESVTSVTPNVTLRPVGGERLLEPGDTWTTTIAVERSGGFTLLGMGYSKPITLETSSGAGLEVSMDPTVLQPGQVSATLRVKVPANATDMGTGVTVSVNAPGVTSQSSSIAVGISKPLPAGSTPDLVCTTGTTPLKNVAGSGNRYQCITAKDGVHAPGQYWGSFQSGDNKISQLTQSVWVEESVGVCIYWGRDLNGPNLSQAYVRARNGGNSLTGPKNSESGRWGVVVKRSGVPEGGTQWLVFTDRADAQIRGLSVDVSGSVAKIVGWNFRPMTSCPW